MYKAIDSSDRLVRIKQKFFIRFHSLALHLVQLTPDVLLLLIQISTFALLAYVTVGLTIPAAISLTYYIKVFLVAICAIVLSRAIVTLFPTEPSLQRWANNRLLETMEKLIDSQNQTIRIAVDKETNTVREQYERGFARLGEELSMHQEEARRLKTTDNNTRNKIQEHTKEADTLRKRAQRYEKDFAKLKEKLQEQIQGLEEDVRAKDDEIMIIKRDLDVVPRNMAGIIENLKADNAAKDDEILVIRRDLDVVPRNMAGIIENIKADNAAKDARIEGLQIENATKDAHIEELRTKNNKKDARIKELRTKNLKKRDARIKELQTKNATKDAFIEELRTRNSKKHARMKEPRRENANKDIAIEDLKEETSGTSKEKYGASNKTRFLRGENRTPLRLSGDFGVRSHHR
ncbi:hypothetical protein DTO271D3_9171 [Paecilomyces variotii]|nr:hypothetical protein DTO271D3_9171 [Paecilomyces variotii]